MSWLFIVVVVDYYKRVWGNWMIDVFKRNHKSGTLKFRFHLLSVLLDLLCLVGMCF